MSSRYRIFLDVCESGSFSRTAEKLGYSQSAVSQAVHTLEEELGTVLLIRKREGLSLTEDGKAYMPYIRSIVSAEENLAKKKAEMEGLVDATIRIGTFTSVSRNFLPYLMSSFRKMYPQTHFELRQGEYDNIHAWIMNDDVDFGFINPQGFEDLDYRIIYHDSMSAVLPPDSPQAKKKTVSLKDLAKQPFILLDEGKNSVPLEAFERYGLKPQIAYKVYDDYSILAMIRQGMGVSVLYSLVTAGFEKDLVIRPVREKIERPIALACRNRQTMTYGAEKFYEYVLKETPAVLRKIGMLV